MILYDTMLTCLILPVRMAYRYGQNYESSVHNIKGIIKTSKVHTIYQSSTKYIKLGNLISKCAHKISTTVTRSSNMKGRGSNQSEKLPHVTSKTEVGRCSLSLLCGQRFPSSFIGLTVFLLLSYVANKRTSILLSFKRDDLTNWGGLYIGFKHVAIRRIEKYIICISR